MPDRYKTSPNKRNPLESVNTKNCGIDIARKLESLHISKTTKPLESPNLCFKAAKHPKIVKNFDKHVCKLIWAHLAHIEKPSVPHIEIEMKFGTITDKTTHRRMACRNKPSTIQNSNGRLVSKVSKKTFLRFQELFCPKPESTIKNTFSAVEQIQTYTKDSVYNAKNRSKAEKLTSWRCSEDLKSKESERNYIKKIRVKDFLIHYPHSPLDAKISISLEIPQCGTSAPFQHSPILRRFKNRSSYSFGNRIPLHLDLTEVSTEKINSSHRSTTYEVEVEMDTIFKKAILTNDEEKFGEYMNSFLHTGDLIRKAAMRENTVRT
ncbi:ctl1p [Saccharomyces arboricola H-6]|uniref:mRNA-capping enzyme subunit beta n=1 Tax=Saccharomyces arboricola (strain H-6 / AS 2.3317 / CBS 10644) TaxID=1160507 RepID=J8Q6F7_SACAR|nr:ctl1p [Saccharomyces arboricola H-6]